MADDLAGQGFGLRRHVRRALGVVERPGLGELVAQLEGAPALGVDVGHGRFVSPGQCQRRDWPAGAGEQPCELAQALRVLLVHAAAVVVQLPDVVDTGQPGGAARDARVRRSARRRRQALAQVGDAGVRAVHAKAPRLMGDAVDKRSATLRVARGVAADEHLGGVQRGQHGHRPRPGAVRRRARGLEVPQRALVLADRHRDHAEVARDRPEVRRPERDDVAAFIRDEQVVDEPRASPVAEQRRELGEQRHREQPWGIAREVLEVLGGELVELAPGLLDPALLGQQQREHAAPAAHERQRVGLRAQKRLGVEVTPANALLKEALAHG